MRRMVSSSKYFTDGLSQCELSRLRSESHLVVWILSKRSNAIKHAVARQLVRIGTLVELTLKRISSEWLLALGKIAIHPGRVGEDGISWRSRCGSTVTCKPNQRYTRISSKV